MTERTIPDTVRRELEKSATADILLGFMTITHPELDAPIRIVNDLFDYIKGGKTYTGIVYDFRILNDGDGIPETELVVANIDRRIGNALRRTSERAKIAFEVCSSSDFDLSKDPRQEIGVAATIYAYSSFELVDVSVNAMELRGRVMLRDYAQEPWPYITASQTRLPGLFR